MLAKWCPTESRGACGAVAESSPHGEQTESYSLKLHRQVLQKQAAQLLHGHGMQGCAAQGKGLRTCQGSCCLQLHSVGAAVKHIEVLDPAGVRAAL